MGTVKHMREADPDYGRYYSLSFINHRSLLKLIKITAACVHMKKVLFSCQKMYRYIINLTFLHLLLLNYEIINDSLHTVLGPLFEIRFMLLHRRLDIFPELQKKLKEMENLANTQTLNEWEKKLVSVMKNFAKG